MNNNNNLSAEEKIKDLRFWLSRLILSMSAHPDCTKGTEFYDYVSGAQKVLESQIPESIERGNTEEVKHTPLLWSGCHDGNCSCGLIFSNAADMVVAYVASSCKRDEGVNLGEGLINTSEQFKANAKFIIEACNNYYSLKEQLSLLQEDRDKRQEDAEHNAARALEIAKERDLLQEENKKLKETIQLGCDVYSDDVKDLREQLKTKDQEIEELSLYKHSCNESIAHLHRENEKLTQQIKDLGNQM